MRPETYSYITDDGDENNRSKKHKKAFHQKKKKKSKFEDHKPCLEATRLENKIKQLEKYKVDVDSVREKHYNS